MYDSPGPKPERTALMNEILDFRLTPEQVALLKPYMDLIADGRKGAILAQIIIARDGKAICRSMYVDESISQKIQKIFGVKPGKQWDVTLDGIMRADRIKI